MIRLFFFTTLFVSLSGWSQGLPEFKTFSPEEVDVGCSFKDENGASMEVSVTMGHDLDPSRGLGVTVKLMKKGANGKWTQVLNEPGLWESPGYRPELKYVQYTSAGVKIEETDMYPFEQQSLDIYGNEIQYFNYQVTLKDQSASDAVCSSIYSP